LRLRGEEGSLRLLGLLRLPGGHGKGRANGSGLGRERWLLLLLRLGLTIGELLLLGQRLLSLRRAHPAVESRGEASGPLVADGQVLHAHRRIRVVARRSVRRIERWYT
jgi:hypothetical protein